MTGRPGEFPAECASAGGIRGGQGLPASPTRILLVDDHEIILHGLRALLSPHPEFQICGSAGNGLQGVAQARALQPDLVVMDLIMPGLNGVDAARRILEHRPGVKILVLTMHASDQLLREIKQAGAHGYVMKSDAGRELVSALQAIRGGKTFFSSARGALARPRASVQFPGNGSVLTPRETEVLILLAEGNSNRQAGVRLGISMKTVETHRSRLGRKLQMHSVAELVRYAIRNGYIAPLSSNIVKNTENSV